MTKKRTLTFALTALILGFTTFAVKAQTQPNLPVEKISKIETTITSFMSRQNINLEGGGRLDLELLANQIYDVIIPQ